METEQEAGAEKSQEAGAEKSQETEAGNSQETGKEINQAAFPKAKFKLKYSNLLDRETRDRVEDALKNAGLKEEKIKSFFSAVDEYNNAVGKENLV